MQKIRSFIAIPLDSSVQRAARRLVQRLAGDKDGIKWVPTDNLHLTLKFLGDVDNVEIPPICDRIRKAVAGVAPFALALDGVGGFPNLERPRVVFASATDESDQLVPLVARLEKLLAEVGFKPEPRDYVPHLTLGRTRGGSRRPSPELTERLEREKETHLGVAQIDSIQLMASFLDKAGPTYQVMDTIQLGQEE